MPTDPLKLDLTLHTVPGAPADAVDPELLARIDRAGLAAAAAMAHVVGPTPLAAVEDEAARRKAVEAFSLALAGPLAGATLTAVRSRLLRSHDLLTSEAAAGRLSYGMFVAESIDKREVDGGAPRPADPEGHPTIAYLDRLAKAAAEAAVDAYRGELSGDPIADRLGEQRYAEASQKALDAFKKTLAELPSHQVWGELKKHVASHVPPAAGWTIVLTAGAGLLASLLLAPKSVARVLEATGATIDLGLDRDFTVVRTDGGLTLDLGGAAYVLPAALAEGRLWEQTASCFRAEVRATMGYGPASVTATVGTGPEGPSWSVMAKLSLASW